MKTIRLDHSASFDMHICCFTIWFMLWMKASDVAEVGFDYRSRLRFLLRSHTKQYSFPYMLGNLEKDFAQVC